MGHRKITNRCFPTDYVWKLAHFPLWAVNLNPMLFWGQDRLAFLCLGREDYNAASSCEQKEPLNQPRVQDCERNVTPGQNKET